MWRVVGCAGLLLSLTSSIHPTVFADGDFHSSRFVTGDNKDGTSFSATITTTDRGIWIDVRGQETVQGQAPTPQNAPPAAPAAAPAPAPASAAPAAQQAPPPAGPTITRSWYDPAWGYFSETSDGHVNNLTGVNIGSVASAPGGWAQVGEQQHPNTVPMAFTVDGQLQDIVWVPQQANENNVQWGAPPDAPPNTVINGGGGTDPHQVALDVLGHIPLPNIKIRVNPDIGLVAMPDWFWVDGYNGNPIQQSRTVTLPPPAPGLPPTSFTVTVTITPSEYDWLFGDGGSLVAHSLGQPYPAESDLKHIYEYSSLPFASGFPVTLTVQFRAQFSVNGGAPQPLPTIRHTYEADHRVQEIQAIVNGH